MIANLDEGAADQGVHDHGGGVGRRHLHGDELAKRLRQDVPSAVIDDHSRDEVRPLHRSAAGHRADGSSVAAQQSKPKPPGRRRLGGLWQSCQT
jgi:hypothetical protein